MQMPQRGAVSYSVRGVNSRPLSHRKEMSARNGSRGVSFLSTWNIPTILHCKRRPRVRSILILCMLCVRLPSTYTMWLDHNQVYLVVTSNTPKEHTIKAQQFRWRINGESTVLFRRKGAYTLRLHSKSVGCSGTT